MRIQVIGRSAGRSATAAAAYRSGEEVKDERTGASHDYTGKSDIYASEILKPENAPERLGDRTTLWNEVERNEKRKDSQLCNEIMIALPAELTHAQKQTLTREYVQGQFVEQGMIADIGYHDFDSHNPHAHIMLTMRSVDADGFGKKQRQWNKRDAVKDYRKHWAEYANRALEEAGYDDRIDHRSLKEQGIEREPQIHLGAKVLEMEARGIQTRVGDESRRIAQVNRDLERQSAERANVQAAIAAEQSQTATYALPELSHPSELESEAHQPANSRADEGLFPELKEPQSRDLSAPNADTDLTHWINKLRAMRREKAAPETFPEASEPIAEIEQPATNKNEPSATAESALEKLSKWLSKSAESQQQAAEQPHARPAETQAPMPPETQRNDAANATASSPEPNASFHHQDEATQATTASQSAEEKQAIEKRKRRREIYRQYAAKFVGKSLYECDRLVTQQLMSELLSERGGQRLRDDEYVLVGAILLQGPVAQQLKQTQGKEAGITYAMTVLKKAQKIVEKAQCRSRSRGIEL